MASPAAGPQQATHTEDTMDTAHFRLSFGRLLLTGAAGALGRVLRPRLAPRCTLLRVSDVAAMEAAASGEEVIKAALEDRDSVHALLQGIDA
ncbi:MAG TPA: hypothetical protein VKP68_08150, partial [Ramlibacter sp.]|nr:hypothetical protein [Ramlibacter sp.]